MTEPLGAVQHLISFMTIFPPAENDVLGVDLEASTYQQIYLI